MAMRAADLLLERSPEEALDLPSVILYPQRSTGSLRVARHLAGLFSVDTHVPCMEDSAASAQNIIEYTKTGSAICRVGKGHQDDAIVEALLECAATQLIEKRRRVIVVLDAGRLVTHAQHAMRKVIEDSMASCIFVLLVDSPGQLDGALKSRSVILNCSRVDARCSMSMDDGRDGDDLTSEIGGETTEKRDTTPIQSLTQDQIKSLQNFLAVRADLDAARSRGAAVLTRERNVDRAFRDICIKFCNPRDLAALTNELLLTTRLQKTFDENSDCSADIVSRAAHADSVGAQMRRLSGVSPKSIELPLRLLLLN